jgi:hypothetical protein
MVMNCKHLEGSVRPTIRDTTSATVVPSSMYIVLSACGWAGPVVWASGTQAERWRVSACIATHKAARVE